jgi:hypothetical protein
MRDAACVPACLAAAAVFCCSLCRRPTLLTSSPARCPWRGRHLRHIMAAQQRVKPLPTTSLAQRRHRSSTMTAAAAAAKGGGDLPRRLRGPRAAAQAAQACPRAPATPPAGAGPHLQRASSTQSPDGSSCSPCLPTAGSCGGS